MSVTHPGAFVPGPPANAPGRFSGACPEFVATNVYWTGSDGVPGPRSTIWGSADLVRLMPATTTSTSARSMAVTTGFGVGNGALALLGSSGVADDRRRVGHRSGRGRGARVRPGLAGVEHGVGGRRVAGRVLARRGVVGERHRAEWRVAVVGRRVGVRHRCARLDGDLRGRGHGWCGRGRGDELGQRDVGHPDVDVVRRAGRHPAAGRIGARRRRRVHDVLRNRGREGAAGAAHRSGAAELPALPDVEQAVAVGVADVEAVDEDCGRRRRTCRRPPRRWRVACCRGW